MIAEASKNAVGLPVQDAVAVAIQENQLPLCLSVPDPGTETGRLAFMETAFLDASILQHLKSSIFGDGPDRFRRKPRTATARTNHNTP